MSRPSDAVRSRRHAVHARLDGDKQDRVGALVVLEPPASPPFDVFESKLRIPVAHPGTVSRTGLVNRLRSERSIRLTAIVATSGYGKTTLLAQWAARDERPFAWLTIDARDNDPLVLLRHFAAAFDRVEALDPSLLELLADPGPSVWSAAAPRLTAAVASCSRPFVAVLDEADHICSSESADIVAALSAHVPAGSMLVLAGRASPPVPLARLRAGGDVLELLTADLALSRREAQLLLRSTGVELPDESVAELTARTEGWAAGLHLAALAVDEVGLEADTGGCDGADMFFADYFGSEYLSHLPPERLAFLRRTAALERMSGPLCDAVLESGDSAAELEELERLHLFLVPLDRQGGWYRYHHLFRDVLRRELERHEPELIAPLNRRAADWFEEHGDLESALDHADAAGDSARVARILTAIAPSVYHSGRVASLERWLARFAAHAPLDAHPDIAVLGGWIHALCGRADDSERWLEAAERGTIESDGGGSADPGVTLLRSAACAHGVERMGEDVDAAVAALPAGSPWLASALVVQGAASMLRGADEGADAQFAAAAEAAERAGEMGTRILAISERSLLAAAAGDHQTAERFALEARDLLATSAIDGYVTSAIVHAAAARFFLRHGQWDDARGELTAAERNAAALTHALPWFAVQTRVALASAYVTLRDRGAALGQLAEIDRIVSLRPRLGVLGGQVVELRQRIDQMPASFDGRTSGLTRAELRLLPLLATHLSFREIGERLFVSRNTIKTQAIAAYRKLGVSSRSAAIERATELGLVDARASEPVRLVRTG